MKKYNVFSGDDGCIRTVPRTGTNVLMIVAILETR